MEDEQLLGARGPRGGMVASRFSHQGPDLRPRPDALSLPEASNSMYFSGIPDFLESLIFSGMRKRLCFVRFLSRSAEGFWSFSDPRTAAGMHFHSQRLSRDCFSAMRSS